MEIHGFIDTHDEQMLFTIPYIVIAVFVVVFLNLFAFLVWIMTHYLIDVYMYRLRGYSVRYSVLKSVHNCKIDFMFFFVGLGMEVILSYYFAVALGGGMRIIGSILRVIPRLVGSVKAAEGIGHVAFDIAHRKNKKYSKIRSEEPILINMWDYTAVIISALFMRLAFYIPMASGKSFYEVVNIMIHAVRPF